MWISSSLTGFIVTALLSTSTTPNKNNNDVNTMINLIELLSTCVDACGRGCKEIRAIQSKRLLGDGDTLKVEFKDPLDAKSALTEADGAAQRAICNALIHTWGSSLKIIGEEENDENNDENINTEDYLELSRDLLSYDDDIDIPTARLQDITIYVDPLDGTREFVESRLRSCQTLVGITVNGKAVAGAMGVPFPAGDLTQPPSIVHGLVGIGAGMLGEPPIPVYNINDIEATGPLLATGDGPMDVMVAAREVVTKGFGGKNLLYGGAGNKILATAFGQVDCTIQHKYGGPWDTCAPEAVIKAMGGKITDLFGDPISVYTDGKRNAFGFVATSKNTKIEHAALCTALAAAPDVQEYRTTVETDP
jgi:3'-phosphoadenosine 5'-phosphosulfate (PAPS) 3'-phosphatase